jgi:hypothetical protein
VVLEQPINKLFIQSSGVEKMRLSIDFEEVVAVDDNYEKRLEEMEDDTYLMVPVTDWIVSLKYGDNSLPFSQTLGYRRYIPLSTYL